MIKKEPLFFAILFVAAVVLGRLLPHVWNFTPLFGAAIIMGAYFGARYSALVVMVSMLLSDIFIGFYEPALMFAVYGSVLLVAVLTAALRVSGAAPLALTAAGASLLFFLTTNFAVWAFTPWYPSGIEGLYASLIAGLPFLKHAVLGDVLYTMVFYVAVETARSSRLLYGADKVRRTQRVACQYISR